MRKVLVERFMDKNTSIIKDYKFNRIFNNSFKWQFVNGRFLSKYEPF